MLLAIDVGNSNTSVGLFDRDKQLRFLASLDTDSRKTADQISIDLMNLFALYHFRFEDVTGAILCSVVPPLNFMMEKALARLLGKPPMVVGPGVRTGLNIRLAVQSQVGADIVADAVAALEKRLAETRTRLDELDADVERQRREKRELDIEIAIRKGTLELLGKEPGAVPEKPGQPREGRPRQTDQ